MPKQIAAFQNECFVITKSLADFTACGQQLDKVVSTLRYPFCGSLKFREAQELPEARGEERSSF